MKYFLLSLKNTFTYGFSAFFSMISSLLYIGINILLWEFLYKNDQMMINYMTTYTIISCILSFFYTRGIAEQIGNKVASGNFVLDLIRPINMFYMAWQNELANVCSNFLIKGIPIILIYIRYLLSYGNFANLVPFILAVILSHILYLLIYSLLGFSAFIFIEIWPIGRLIDDTIRLLAGGFIPIAILPKFLQSITQVLPFRFLFSFPLNLLLNDSIVINELINEFIAMILWIICFALANYFMYKTAIRKATVQGG